MFHLVFRCWWRTLARVRFLGLQVRACVRVRVNERLYVGVERLDELSSCYLVTSLSSLYPSLRRAPRPFPQQRV